MKVVIPAGCTGLFLNAQMTYAAASASPTSDATLGMPSFANSDNHTNNMAQHGRCSAGDEARFDHRKSHKTETTRQESSLSPGHTSREQHASGYSRRRRRKSHKDNTTTTTTTSKSSGQDSASLSDTKKNDGASANNRNALRSGNEYVGNDQTRAGGVPGADDVDTSGASGRGFFSILKSAAKTAGQAAKNAASAIRSSVSSSLTVDFISSGITVYTEDAVLAEGGFGTVYRARDGIDRDYTFALKWMIAQERSHVEDAMWEIEVHRRVAGHPNVMELIDHLVRPSVRIQSRNVKDILLLYPLCRNGSVFDAISNASLGEVRADWPFPELVALRHFLEACAGTKHIHERGLLHRDIKPHNILLFGASGGTNSAVLMDLGSAAPLDVRVENRRQALELQDECNSKCSPPYRAPELHEPDPSKVIDGRVDVFSLGATLYAMAFGHNPFEHPLRGFEKLALLNGNMSFPDNRRNTHGEKYSKGFCSLIKGMLRSEPARRTKLSRVIKKATELLEKE